MVKSVKSSPFCALQAGGNGKLKFGTSNGIDTALQLAAGAISPRKAHGRTHLHDENFTRTFHQKHDVNQQRMLNSSQFTAWYCCILLLQSGSIYALGLFWICRVGLPGVTKTVIDLHIAKCLLQWSCSSKGMFRNMAC